MLTMGQLYLVAATVSVLTMLFNVSFRAYMPLLLERDELLQGNSVLQGTDAVAEAGGFAAAGLLVQIVTAPMAIAFDAVSFLLSSLSLLSIRGRDPRVAHRVEREEGKTSLHEIVLGLQIVCRHPVLRAITLTTVVFELVGNAIGVVIMLFFVRDLHLTAGVMGPVFGIGGVSAFLGAVLCGRVVRRFGLGWALVWSLLFNNLGMLATVLAGGPLPLVIVLLSLAQTTDAGRTIYEITVTSVFQEEAPEGVAGRVFGTYETLKSAAMVGGLLAGGTLGQSIGLRPVLILALVANLLVPLVLVFSPVRRIRALADDPAPEQVAV
jgi:Na+/melibiose symporter-like transporter